MSEEDSVPSATLLFVDDEPSILSSLRRLFRPQGYKILTAESGAEGLRILESETVDLVVSDMRMPEMDGAKFLEQVRERWPAVVRILLTGYADVSSTIAAINRGEIFRYVSKPWDDNAIILTIGDALERKRLESENARLMELTRQQNEELKELNASLEQKVAERTEELQVALGSLEKAHGQLRQGFLSTVHIFSGLVELRGGRLAGHSRRVADFARQIAQRLSLDEVEQQDVLLAALLHDIGKVGLPDSCMDRPFSALPANAKAEVMRHPIKGQQVLMGVEQLADAAKIIRHHHEYMDGSGYPDQLVGLAIPLGARILTVANDYDALQMGTLTIQTHSPIEAREVIVKNRGRRYDPEVVDAFIDLLSEKLNPAVKEVSLRPVDLKPGMILTRDLLHHEGYLLLPRGRVVDEKMIEQLCTLETADGYTLSIFVHQKVDPFVLRDVPPEKPAKVWKEVPMSPDRLKEGMVLSRPLMHHEGYLLLARGHYLDDIIIKQLRRLEATSGQPLTVYIRMEDRT
jgi:response regulator RpfG family c-di-GMP phosphodiesterase